MGTMKKESKISITTKSVRDAREEKKCIARGIMFDVNVVEAALDNLKNSIDAGITMAPGLDVIEKLREMQKRMRQITLDLGHIKTLCGGVRSEPKHEVWK